jgi:tripartite-type tricarboxylate transporter receptor subunit TctC
MTRLARLLTAASLAFATLPAPALLAQEVYPNRPIRVIVGFPPGGGADLVARLLADKMGSLLGQTIVVENRGGAAGIIAGQQVSRAEPDGYTALIAGSPMPSAGKHSEQSN